MPRVHRKKDRRHYSNRTSLRTFLYFGTRFFQNTLLGIFFGSAAGLFGAGLWILAVTNVDPLLNWTSKDKENLSEVMKMNGMKITSNSTVQLSEKDLKESLTAFSDNLDDVLKLYADIRVNGKDTVYIFTEKDLSEIDQLFNSLAPN